MPDKDNGSRLTSREDLQEEVAEKIIKEKPSRQLFGTFGGVFTPPCSPFWALSCICGRVGWSATPVCWERCW